MSEVELTQEQIEKRKKERERVKKWRENPVNREKIRSSARKWREKNLEKSLAITREWRKTHPDYERQRYPIVKEQRKTNKKAKKQFAEDMISLAESLRESEEQQFIRPTQDENVDSEDNNYVLTKRKRSEQLYGGFLRKKRKTQKRRARK